MDNNTGADLAAGTKAIEENTEKNEQFEAEMKKVDNVVIENEKRHSAGSSSDSASESGPEDLKKYDSEIVKVRDVPEGDAALAHLPEHERAILKRQLDIPTVSVSWLKLYRYATTWDKVIVGIAAFCAIGAGAVMPLMTVSFALLNIPCIRTQTANLVRSSLAVWRATYRTTH